VKLISKVKLLGVTLHTTLSMDQHVTDVVHSCSYQIRPLWHIRPCLTMEATKMIAQCLVTARLDYGNTLLLGKTARKLNRLQMAQNALARAVCQAPNSFNATDIRRSLHWLPIRQRIDYKIATMRYKVEETNTPVYMASLISDYIPSRTLRSSDNCLKLPLLFHFFKSFLRLAHLPSGTDYGFTVDLLQLLTVLNANSKRLYLSQHTDLSRHRHQHP